MNKKINEKWEEICKCMKEFDEVYHKLATYFNLSDSSFWILYDLYTAKDGYTQKELCDNWYVSKQTINSAIKYLLKKEYITLTHEEDNKKNKKIFLSDKGRDIAQKTIEKVLEIENKSFINIDIKEMNIVINFFKKQATILKSETNKLMKGELENE